MITALTIKCDWAGCKATITVPKEHDAAQKKGWKQENYGLFSMHLCIDHRRHSWDEVRMRQFKSNEAPSTSS